MFQSLFYPHRKVIRKIRRDFHHKLIMFHFSATELQIELMRMHARVEDVIQQVRDENKRIAEEYYYWPPYFI